MDRELRDWNFAMEPEAVAQPTQQGADDFFRRRVLAADARHIPRTACFGQTVPIHIESLAQ